MEAVLLVIHLIVSSAIIVVVLLQPADAGGFLGSGGGSTGNMMAPRRSADLMTRVTAGLATCFFITSLVLAVMAGHAPEKKSILDVMPAAQKDAPATATDTKEVKEVKEVAPAKAEEDKTPTAPVSR